MFTDLHSHILHGIDDGSETFEISIDMIRIAISEGIDTIMATPHFIAGHSLYKPALRERSFRLLQDYIQEYHLPVKLILGNEIYLDERIIDLLKEGQCQPLGSSRYVLLEFTLSDLPINLESILDNLQRNGYFPILAHPERSNELMKDTGRVDALLRQGCLIQVNTCSITGFYGSTIQKISRKLFETGRVHFVGTDAHSNRIRSPRMITAFRTVGQWVGIEEANLIFLNNPRFILEDLPYVHHESITKRIAAARFFKTLMRNT